MNIPQQVAYQTPQKKPRMTIWQIWGLIGMLCAATVGSTVLTPLTGSYYVSTRMMLDSIASDNMYHTAISREQCQVAIEQFAEENSVKPEITVNDAQTYVARFPRDGEIRMISACFNG